MPKGIPLTEEEQARRRRQVFEAAVHLFITQGFLETSMREIAAAAGVGKSTLYDYFETKDEILITYFENEVQAMIASAQAILQQDLPAETRLVQVMQAHLAYLLANKNDYIRLSVEAERLGAESQARLHRSRYAYQDMIRRLIEAGIAEGSFRPVNAHLAMRVILAALGPLVFTTRPTGTPQEMLTAVLDILFKGLKM